jgi:DNA polymerase elongation subunit (family B)
LVRKIQLNSAFGACGNQYFRYYDQEIAEAITISGQVSIRWIENGLNGFLNKTLKTAGVDYVIASDTDSVYLRLGSLVKQVMPNETDPQKITKFLNKFCNEVLQPFIDKQYAALAEQQNAYAQKMRMKREGIASKGIWTAKKRYMLSIWMGEDDVLLSKPETKIMGLETAKSSTPEIVRDALKKAIGIIMVGKESELREYVAEFKTDFFARSVEEIAFPRGCNGLKEYRDDTTIYRKSTPLHVKGALLYNHWLREKDLGKRYPKIGDGEKIKYVYLRVPNPIRDKVISFSAGIPKEFGLETKYIDYDTQFEKSFEEPLNAILNVIGWQMREVSSLEGLFTWT